MSASLVGSEMCIRDRRVPEACHPGLCSFQGGRACASSHGQHSHGLCSQGHQCLWVAGLRYQC
eukprot:15043715-Alexandrium_andersonii.AAC.1